MEIKQAKPGTMAAQKGLGLADKQIAALKNRFLPYEPHLLNVSTDDPYENPFYHEYEKLPFEPIEVMQLQYMTMISDGDRGVAAARGDWHDEIYNQAASPGSVDARSSTTTPNPAKDLKKTAVKMSISDYKNLKEKGIKPSPKPLAVDAERKPGHSRNTSAVTAGTPMSRMSSLEGPPVKQNGVSASATSASVEKKPSKENEKPNTVHSSTAPQEKPRPTTNGHVDPTKSLQVKDTNKAPPKPQSQANHVRNHALPPRPQSPPRKNLDVKPQVEQKQKRPLESGDASQPEKRTKIEHSRTPSNSSMSLPRKPETPAGKLGLNLHKSSSLPKKETSNKPNHNSKPSSEKPMDLPPLLSPLPADLDSSPGMKSQSTSGFKKLESGKNSSQSTPSKYKLASDTIVVKKPSAMESSPLSEPPKSPLAPLPALLSPTLPQVIEDELIRLQQKSAEKAEKHALSTAEARYEKSRQPDTPGVARKTVIPKVGHPPKKNQGESSKPKDRPERFIIKLKYKKRKSNDIRRILGLKPHPDRRFLELEKERIRSTSKAPDTEDEDDVPLSKITVKPTSAPISKKRSSDSFESRTSEPAPKRPKGPEPIDVSKSHKTLDPPFKSPALTAPPSQKSLLATPKKSGDAMKSVAMRRVDSTDALSRTPQTSTSTPASAEKPRLNGTLPDHGDEKKFGESALRLKRKMDEYLKTKGGNRDTITERERKLGVCYGLECLVTYMNTWVALEKAAKRPGANDKAWIDGVRLWDFINAEARTFPVLSVLGCQVGALMREEVNRIYVRMVEEKREGGIEGLGANQRWREKCWMAVGRGRGMLKEFGVNEVLGPWSSAAEALTYCYGVLEKYCRKEKLEWKRDFA
ncbi:hypothetical protein L207DRAFT_513265 [Hyaloscypha variabilis F]|uniref:Uncharacterized protein n=1 Tax=Hyaloscypha variabilis (strain UAMH 11265 / GT02V1 / F) TaxID=1149755 RepID=A0A2J6RJS8_HYAVF|nr:hypothetical protein L207DRAFT_513265 [Hyaloscypha variabilis F]